MWKRKNHVCNRVPKLNLRSKATAKRDLGQVFRLISIGKDERQKKNRIKQHKINQTKRTHRAEERRQNSTFTNG